MRALLDYYYSRYGLADVLIHEFGASRKTVFSVLADITEEAFEEAAKRRLKALRSEIRLQFPTEGLVPKASITGSIVHEPDGTPGAQISTKGFYIRPHVLLGAGGLNGSYGLLNSYLPTKTTLLQRSYPPATKLSLGRKSAANVNTSLAFVLACQVTTLTPQKAARKSGDGDRAAVIPDLPLPDLITYLHLLDFMQQKGTDPRAGTVRKSGEGVNVDGNRGNFPEAPPEWAFGGLGVMAAIGTWARDNRRLAYARPMLEALAGRRFYVIDTSGTSRVEMAQSHLVRLSTEHSLAPIIRAAWKVNTGVQDENFYRAFRRWLLLYSPPSFNGFLAVRAQYPSEFSPLFEDYFMQRHERDLIDSARMTGQHVSRQAWFAAEGKDIESKRKKTQSILAGLESLLRDCSSGPEMLARLSVQVARLTTGSSFPPESQRFFDAVAADDPDKLSLQDARNLLMAYMHLRAPITAVADTEESEEDASENTEAITEVPPEDPLASVEQL